MLVNREASDDKLGPCAYCTTENVQLWRVTRVSFEEFHIWVGWGNKIHAEITIVKDDRKMDRLLCDYRGLRLHRR